MTLENYQGKLDKSGVMGASTLKAAFDTVSPRLRGAVLLLNETVSRSLWFYCKQGQLQETEKALYDNVQNTIAKYREAWGDSDVQGHILDDEECLVSIQKAEPELVSHFKRDPRKHYTKALCQVATMFVHGGYFFDLDLQVINARVLDLQTEFSAVLVDGKDYYASTFVAIAQGHPVARVSPAFPLDNFIIHPSL